MTSPAGHAPSVTVVVGASVVPVDVDVVAGAVEGDVDVDCGSASSTQAASTNSDTMHGTRRRTTTG
jgi:hypothetical protein